MARISSQPSGVLCAEDAPLFSCARSFLRIVVMLGLSIALFATSACGGREQPITCTDASQSPQTILGADLIVPTPAGPYKLFENGREFGCVGLRWSGQTSDPPAFVAEFTSDGKYKIRDAGGTFTDTAIKTNVAAGVSSFDAFFFLSKENPSQIDCRSYVQGGIEGCIGAVGSRADCLMAWRIQGIPMGGGDGTCRLCVREQCNGRDNDCDGVADNGACGDVTGKGCTYLATVEPTSPGCDASAPCKCLVDSTNQVYVCTGTAEEPQSLQWRLLTSVASTCNDGNNGKPLFCGNQELLCDLCAGNRTWRLKEGARCLETSLLRYTPPR